MRDRLTKRSFRLPGRTGNRGAARSWAVYSPIVLPKIGVRQFAGSQHGGTDGEYLPGLHCPVESPKHIVNIGIGPEPVDLIQINMISSQSTQTRFKAVATISLVRVPMRSLLGSRPNLAAKKTWSRRDRIALPTRTSVSPSA